MMKNVPNERETTEQVVKEVKSLENKLDKQLQKYNQAVAHNRELKEKIDALRRERIVFDKIYSKLEKELSNKKEMRQIIEKADKAYKEREKAKAEMETLKKEAEQEQEEFQREWNKLEKLIEQDKQVKNFIKTKNQNEEAKKVAIKDDTSSMKKETTQKASGPKGDYDSLKVIKKIADKGHSLHKETTSTMDDMMKVQEYEEAFNSIKEATQINDIDKLIEQFEKAESNNFSLLKYVESLSSDIKSIDEEIKAVQMEIEKYSQDGVDDSENNRDKQFKKINDELEKTEKETKEYERQYQETIKTINALKIGIKSIFDRIG